MTESERRQAEQKECDRQRSRKYYAEHRDEINARRSAQRKAMKDGTYTPRKLDAVSKPSPRMYTADDVTVGAVAKLYRNIFDKAGARILRDTKKRGVVIGKYKHFFLVEYAPHIRKGYQYCQLHRQMVGDVIILGGRTGGGKKNG